MTIPELRREIKRLTRERNLASQICDCAWVYSDVHTRDLMLGKIKEADDQIKKYKCQLYTQLSPPKQK